MKNVKIEKKGNKLVIEVDLSQNFGQSKSGKSTIIATSEGNEALGEGIFLGLNVYKKT